MRRIIVLMALQLLSVAAARAAETPASVGCNRCHAALEPAVHFDRNMMRALGDMDLSQTGGCITCHGGSPLAVTIPEAHTGGQGYGLPTWFSPNPTTAGVLDLTCGVCHKDKVAALRHSRMQGRPANPGSLVDGSATYLRYLRAPQQLDAGADPTCRDSCHLWPRQPDLRSAQGCAICHFARSADGFYTGRDSTLIAQMRAAGKHGSREHTMMATAKAPSVMDGSIGVPQRACAECHRAGKQISLRFAGWATRAPLDRRGSLYSHGVSDIHAQKGMTCQDCHTALGIHGDGSYRPAGRQVEIECTDCHGTGDTQPWDLPLFWGDGGTAVTSGPRGLAERVLPTQLHGSPVSGAGLFLLTARGNPFGNVVRTRDRAVLYDVYGVTHAVPLLAALPITAPHRGTELLRHETTLTECYACHSATVTALSNTVKVKGKGDYRPLLDRNSDGGYAPLLNLTSYSPQPSAVAAQPHDIVTKGAACERCHLPEELRQWRTAPQR